MRRPGLSIATVAVLVLASVTMAAAADVTDRVQNGRMTVLKLDREAGRVQCVEHHHWVSVAKRDLSAIGVGDVVKIARAERGPAHVVLLRSAADELTSPE
jgi:hypothetical protein